MALFVTTQTLFSGGAIRLTTESMLMMLPSVSEIVAKRVLARVRMPIRKGIGGIRQGARRIMPILGHSRPGCGRSA
jgi:hypothetical protein